MSSLTHPVAFSPINVAKAIAPANKTNPFLQKHWPKKRYARAAAHAPALDTSEAEQGAGAYCKKNLAPKNNILNLLSSKRREI